MSVRRFVGRAVVDEADPVRLRPVPMYGRQPAEIDGFEVDKFARRSHASLEVIEISG